MKYVIIVGIIIVVVAVLVMLRGRGQSTDGMSSFRRQIDALSPEARRSVVDQVQRVADEDNKPDRGQRPDGEPPSPDSSDDEQGN